MARTRTRSLDQPDENENENGAVVSDSRRRRRQSEASDAVIQSPARSKDRPTPSARQSKPRTGESKGLLSRIPVVSSIVAYFHGVASELQKITWPSREETMRLTWVVLAVTIAFAIALGLLDTFLSWWFQQAFARDSEPLFLTVAVIVLVVAGGTYTVLRRRI
ncbi:MAG: preprotein translocase subunit SecE [Chloroflexi bacterium]|nr:preprotein translocase subunit SecE [Chloroflexota bacterium]